ncbi:hypothetical protein MtrunA17_Chr1g0185291 [Medicago truncatula]|uniref:Uncharacterized protein n=1 Tax=Medicago truncatula TaxID=3880 RepID=G7IDM3_MEDTR|nr:hypothetical protein MTR_1g071690 [Medicago truncatula]RHN80164.1 hypothetical protein MtrunA17_Chr1g0185291 [Medicago truncatula]
MEKLTYVYIWNLEFGIWYHAYGEGNMSQMAKWVANGGQALVGPGLRQGMEETGQVGEQYNYLHQNSYLPHLLIWFYICTCHNQYVHYGSNLNLVAELYDIHHSRDLKVTYN